MRWVLVGLTVAGAACGSTSTPADHARPALEIVALPDISNAAEPVQAQIRERYQALQAALSGGRPPAELASAFGDMGKLFAAAEYYDAAEACLLNAQRLAPGDMRWPYFLGHIFRYRNNPERAAAFFEQTLSHAPDDVPSLVWLAEMQLTLNHPEAARTPLLRAQTLDPLSPAVQYGLGRVALAQEDYAQAVKYLEAALAAAPQASRVHYPLGLAYRGLGDRNKAEQHLRLRGDVDLPPADPLLAELSGLLQNAAAYEARGSQALGARQWSEAEMNLRKAIELAPDNAYSRLNLGTALYLQGKEDAALEQYREAVRLSPGLARAHFAIGVVMESRGRDNEAIASFRAAVAGDPTYTEPRFSLANALRRTGHVEQSLTEYAEVLRLDPAVSQASFGYAIGLVRLGRYREARDRLETAIKTFPDQPGFAHALARLLSAAPDDSVRNGMRAYAIMTDLLAQQRTPALVETMAMTQAELGRFNEAAQWQREAIAAAEQTGRRDLLSHLQENLRLYESGRPCRVPWTADDPVHHPRTETQP